MPLMFVAFRTDASSAMGTGHVMRCLTLADALRATGVTCVFICRPQPGDLIGLIRSRDFEVRRLPPLDAAGIPQSGSDPVMHAGWVGTSIETDAEDTRRLLDDRRWDWLVIDHYGLDERWERSLRPTCRQILVLDDLADRRHDCDILVDPGTEPDLSVRHGGRVPPSALLFVGPHYAILRPEFDRERVALPQAPDCIVPRRLLVMFGGSDSGGHSMEALEAIAATAPKGIVVDVVISAINQEQARLASFCRSHPAYALHVATTEVARLMAQADLIVASGGGATWERLYLRRPALLKIIAENQRKPLEFMAASGLFKLYHDRASLEEVLQEAFSAGVVPPLDIVRNGVPRICLAMQDRLVSLDGPCPFDVRRSFYWVQDAGLRRLFLMRGETPARRDHFRYWRRLLTDPRQRVFSIHQGRRHIGNAGLRNIDAVVGEAELWLYLGDAGERGAGLGKHALRHLHEAIRREGCATAVVHVSRQNVQAYRLYRGAGYRLSQRQDVEAAGFLPEMDVVRMEKPL